MHFTFNIIAFSTFFVPLISQFGNSRQFAPPLDFFLWFTLWKKGFMICRKREDGEVCVLNEYGFRQRARHYRRDAVPVRRSAHHSARVAGSYKRRTHTPCRRAQARKPRASERVASWLGFACFCEGAEQMGQGTRVAGRQAEKAASASIARGKGPSRVVMRVRTPQPLHTCTLCPLPSALCAPCFAGSVSPHHARPSFLCCRALPRPSVAVETTVLRRHSPSTKQQPSIHPSIHPST